MSRENNLPQGDAEIAAKERYKAGEQMIFRDPEHLPKGMSGYIETYPLTREAFLAGAKWQASQPDKVQEKEIELRLLEAQQQLFKNIEEIERLKGLIKEIFWGEVNLTKSITPNSWQVFKQLYNL